MKANRITFDRIKKSPYKTQKPFRINIDKLSSALLNLQNNAKRIESGLSERRPIKVEV